MAKNNCDLCGVEWDNEVQSHRRGQDCVAPLAEKVKGFQVMVARLEKAYAAALVVHDDIEESAFKGLSEDMKAMKEQVKTLNGVVLALQATILKKEKK